MGQVVIGMLTFTFLIASGLGSGWEWRGSIEMVDVQRDSVFFILFSSAD